jgi:hypothetical protein
VQLASVRLKHFAVELDQYSAVFYNVIPGGRQETAIVIEAVAG